VYSVKKLITRHKITSYPVSKPFIVLLVFSITYDILAVTLFKWRESWTEGLYS